jgi:hypothetical protein
LSIIFKIAACFFQIHLNEFQREAEMKKEIRLIKPGRKSAINQ